MTLLAIVFIPILVVIIAVIFVIIKKCAKTPVEAVCPQCGKPVKAGKNFCTSCGAKIK